MRSIPIKQSNTIAATLGYCDSLQCSLLIAWRTHNQVLITAEELAPIGNPGSLAWPNAHLVYRGRQRVDRWNERLFIDVKRASYQFGCQLDERRLQCKAARFFTARILL